MSDLTSEPQPGPPAQFTISGQPFDETIAFFTDELGFRLDLITPADDPALAVLSGSGISLRVDRSVPPTPQRLRIERETHNQLHAPNGIVVDLVAPASGAIEIPQVVPELVISKVDADQAWVVGRAGMRYRDLIPSRLGGRFIASHIEVADGGPVPDLVHHHAIRFQMIFCHRGWVDVVYEDQGPAFRLEPGDCVLQPPHIRHKVLASSAGAQVVEIGCPAEHDTLFDHELVLPTSTIDHDRLFGGQRFVRHDSTAVGWQASIHPGFEVQHTAIEQATTGLASVRVLRSAGQTATAPVRHDGELFFIFVLDGTAGFAVDGSPTSAPLVAGDSVVVPPGTAFTLREASQDLAWLEVVLPS